MRSVVFPVAYVYEANYHNRKEVEKPFCVSRNTYIPFMTNLSVCGYLIEFLLVMSKTSPKLWCHSIVHLAKLDLCFPESLSLVVLS